MPLSIRSPAFAPDGEIPARYTCEGENVSPELRFEAVPAGTRSLALVVDDPDAPDPAAPKRVFVHWVVYDLPPDCTALAEAVRDLPGSARHGTNDWGKTGWGGPCPPIGRHRYFFKLYALDAELGDRGPLTKPQLLDATKGRVVAEAQVVGTYQKRR